MDFRFSTHTTLFLMIRDAPVDAQQEPVDTAEQSLVKELPEDVETTAGTNATGVADIADGLGQDDSHQSSLLDMFTQGLFCFNGSSQTAE